MTQSSRKIKVMYVIGQLSVGGTETQLLELIRRLNRKRYETLVICLSEPATLAQPFIKAGCEVRVLGREKRGRLLVLKDMYLIQQGFAPDIVHSFAYAARAAIPVSRIFFKSRNIISIRAQPERHITWLDYIINSVADYELVNSQKASSTISFGFRRKIPVRVIYNGIDLKEFDQRSIVGAHLDLTSDDIVLCATGRLYKVKGLSFLLDAFAMVLGDLRNVQLWLVGDGPEKENLQRQAIQLGIDTKVKFLGYQDNVPAILRQVHVGVLASQSEGLPNAIIEYMAARLPVVATDVGGNGEVVAQGQSGLLVPFGDLKKMTAALLFFLQGADKAREFGEAGRRRAEKMFSIERLIHETEEIYEAAFAIKK